MTDSEHRDGRTRTHGSETLARKWGEDLPERTECAPSNILNDKL